MATNPFINYYVNQAGTGIGGFQGARFQRGQGFFGNVFKNAILPLLRYLGPKAASLGIDVAKDALSGENVIHSLKSRGKDSARGIASDAADRAVQFAQTGRGRTQSVQGKKRKKSKKKSRKSTASKRLRHSLFD